ncbi:hypothetical protein WN943_023758 [Citrus x changshan-huyou]
MAVDGWKIKRESWGTKSSQWCHPKPSKIPAEQGGKVAGFSSFVSEGGMLSSPASQCIAWTHAQQVSIGGELITCVRVLMTHFRLREQFQISKGHRANT